MAEGNQVNGAPPSVSNEENSAEAHAGALNLEVWHEDGRAYDSSNNRRNEPAVIVRGNLTSSTLWDRIEPGSVLGNLATDGSVLYRNAEHRCWASFTLRQLQDPNTPTPLGQGPSYQLRTLTGLSFVHFDGSYLLEDRQTQETEQVILDLLVQESTLSSMFSLPFFKLCVGSIC